MDNFCVDMSFQFSWVYTWASLVAQMVVKNLPAMQETQVQSLSQEDPLEKGMATHYSILAWRIPDKGAWKAHGITESDKTNALIFMIIIIHLMCYSLLDCNLHKGRNTM